MRMVSAFLSTKANSDFKMPATPPTPFSATPSVPIAESGTTVQFPGNGKTFNVSYDKLVIAVGAYSQSKCTL